MSTAATATAAVVLPDNIVSNYINGSAQDQQNLAEVPHLSWSPSDTVQKIFTYIGFGIVIAWVVFIVGQFVLPKKHGGRGRVSILALIFSLIVAVFCMDLELIPPVINFIVDGANGLVEWIKSLNFGG